MEVEFRTTIRIKLSEEAANRYSIATNKSEFVRKCIEFACNSDNVNTINESESDLDFYMHELHRKIDEVKSKLDSITQGNYQLANEVNEKKESIVDLGEHAATLQAFVNFGIESGDE